MGFYIHCYFDYEEIHYGQIEDINALEYYFVKVILRKQSLVVGCLYRTPDNKPVFIPLTISCLNLVPKYNKLIVLGDTKLNLFDPENSLTNCMDSYGFRQIIREAQTRRRNFWILFL